MNGYFKGLVVVIILLITIPLFWNSCVKPAHNEVNISIPKELPITTDDRKIMADAEKKIEINKSVVPLGKKVITEILIDKKLNATQVDKVVNDWGFKNRLGVFIERDLSGGNFGLSYSTFYYWRLNLDLLAGIEKSGAGLNYQIFKNTSIGLSYGIRYNNLITVPGIYAQVGF